MPSTVVHYYLYSLSFMTREHLCLVVLDHLDMVTVIELIGKAELQ